MIYSGRTEEKEGARLIFLNELIGYYRENCQPERIRETADQIMAQLKRMGIQGSVAYGTALLNVATGYRACGELEESKTISACCFRSLEIMRRQRRTSWMPWPLRRQTACDMRLR